MVNHSMNVVEFSSPTFCKNPAEITEAQKSNERDVHLLSIEGRGVCGLTALIILKEVLRQYQYHQNLPQLPRPCDVFDLASGVGTGGIIVIMLFRLRMTVDHAIKAYTRLSKDIFSRKVLFSQMRTNASLLEHGITRIIHLTLGVDESQAQKINMEDDRAPKCFIGALTAKNLSSPRLFRTYVSPRNSSYNCTIVEAVRATTAEEPFFPSIDIGDANVTETFIHIGSQLNNPVKAVLEEAVSIFPGQCLSCVLSIGSGSRGINRLEPASATQLASGLRQLMNDGERISDEIAKDLDDKGVFYCRLDVDHGVEDIGFEDWERLGEVITHTQKYLEKHEVTQKVSRLVQVLNRRTAIASTAEETLMILAQFLDGLIPVSQAGERWSTVISEFIRIVKPVMIRQPNKAVAETLNMQCALLRDTLDICMQGKDFTELPDELKGNIGQLLEALKGMFQCSPWGEHPMTVVNVKIQNLLQRFWIQNHIAGNVATHDILKYIQRDNSMKKIFTRFEQHVMNENLRRLNVAKYAAYDSSQVSEKASCFKGTRVKLLNEIASWIVGNDPNLAPIFVLDGVAGIGKSTIAKTVAEHAAGINALGASFFFSRSDDSRKTALTFFPTIAYQLAYYDKAFADKIDQALLRNPDVVEKMPINQFSILIMEPLKEAFAMVGDPILIVVDALDECEHDGDAILKIFADSIKNMPRLKIFITTRPELHIRTVLDRYRYLKRFHLQDIEKSVVQSDIRLYLYFHLSENRLRDKFPDIQCWKLAEKDVELLIKTCDTLFIMASTAVKFILDIKQLDPEKQLTWLLKDVSGRDFSDSNPRTIMDSFYQQILVAAVPPNDRERWFERYQTVVGTVVALQYPLPCLALSALVGLDPDNVKRALSHLYSLVAPTGQDLSFRIHHKSFPDFVTSSRCQGGFLIDLTIRHLELGKRCLKILNSKLKPNILNLASFDRFKDNRDIQHLTQDCISQELAYVSTHWATHLSIVSNLDSEAEQLLEYFARNHLLSWLEVLSIIERVETAYSSLDKMSQLLDQSGIASEIFRDGCRFVALNRELIKVAGGHVFSAIAFSPQDSRLFQTYKGERVNLTVVSGYEKNWNPMISVLSGHEEEVNFVTFSADSTKVASASKDKTVRLWDGKSGGDIAVLRGHSKMVNSVTFSQDGMRLASASYDKTVRLWDCQTGGEIAVLRGHWDSVNSVVFSPDGTILASASYDKTVRLWDGGMGAEIAVLGGHTDLVGIVTFSLNGSHLASASEDGTVRLWDGQRGTEITVFEGHEKRVNSVVFSANGTRLASASDDGTVRLWDTKTVAKITVLRGHSGEVSSVVFAPDGTRLASASYDKTVRLWDVKKGATIAVLEGHSGLVNLVMFSPRGTRLASASHDHTVRLWDGRTGAEVAVLRGHSNQVKSVAFSLDGTRLASSSSDRTVKMWNGETNAESGSEQILFPRSHFRDYFEISAVSPDGTRRVSSGYEGVQLEDCKTGVKIADLGRAVHSVVFSPDSTKLACLMDQEYEQRSNHLRIRDELPVRIYDAKTGAQIRPLSGYRHRGTHFNQVNLVVFSPDGMKVASVFNDTVQLWVVSTGEEIFVCPMSMGLTSIVFSPDGTKLALAFECGTVELWDGHANSKIAGFPASVLAFAMNDSTLTLISADKIYQVNYVTGDTLSIPVGMFIETIAEGVRVPDGSNLWIFRADRKHPTLSGLLVVTVDSNGVCHFFPLCWFPPSFTLARFTIISLSRIAVMSKDEHFLLLEIDFSSLV